MSVVLFIVCMLLCYGSVFFTYKARFEAALGRKLDRNDVFMAVVVTGFVMTIAAMLFGCTLFKL